MLTRVVRFISKGTVEGDVIELQKLKPSSGPQLLVEISKEEGAKKGGANATVAKVDGLKLENELADILRVIKAMVLKPQHEGGSGRGV